MSRQTDYKPAYAELARNYALLGATELEIAGFLGTTDRTLRTWKKSFPKFAAALQYGKDQADAKVVGALFNNAVRGNVTAQIFWLKNRRRDTWRDKVDVDARIEGKLETITRRIVDPAK